MYANTNAVRQYRHTNRGMKARGRGAYEVPAPACQGQPPSWAQGHSVSVGRRETGTVAARTEQALQTRSRVSKGERGA